MFFSGIQFGRTSLFSTTLLLTACFTVSNYANAVDNENKKNTRAKPLRLLSASPSKCIALREGRNCYTQVSLDWQVKKSRDYCLYIASNRQVPLKCWQDNERGQLIFDFESNKGITFILVEQQSQEIIADAKVEMGWVHKRISRKRRWRLF